MREYIFKIRKIDKEVFDSINDGQKTIETRAATEKYKKVVSGDTLIFVCGNERIERKVGKVEFYKNIDEMVSVLDFKTIMPFVDSVDEMKRTYFGFPNYKEKIRKCGLVAFGLKDKTD